VGASPPESLFGLFALYAASGPLLWAWRKATRSRRNRRPADRRPSP